MNDQEKPDPKIIERIKTLLKMAEDGRGNENEMAIAMARAEKLMRKYNLDFADLVLQDLDDDESISSAFAIDDFDYTPSRFPHWLGILGPAVSDLFYSQCRIGWKPWKRGQRPYLNMKFFGYKTDLEVCRWTYDFVVREINRLADKYYDDLKARMATWGDSDNNHDIRELAMFNNFSAKALKASFRDGATREVVIKIRRMIADREVESAAAPEASRSMALAVVNKKLQKIQEKFGEADYKDAEGRTVILDAYDKGRDDGKKINITRPLNAPEGEKQLLIGDAS